MAEVNWEALIPPNLLADPQARAISAALSPELNAIDQAIFECLILARLDQLPETVVDLLAWQYHVDFYEPDLTLEQKRALVRTSIDAHRRKGTPYAVELVVKSILEDAAVQEWFDYQGEPGHFRVVVDGQLPSAAAIRRVASAISSVKRLSAHLEALIAIKRESLNNIYLGFGVKQTKFKTIQQQG